jgi:predicted RNase H-like HicB family nuclease
MKMNLTIRIAKQIGCAYRAWCPALPGCEVYGETLTEARSKIQDAIRGYASNLEQVLPRELGRLLNARQGGVRQFRAQAA